MIVLHVCPTPSMSMKLWKEISYIIDNLDWNTAASLEELVKVDLSYYDFVIIDDYELPVSSMLEDSRTSDVFKSYSEQVLFVTRSIKLRKQGFLSCSRKETVDAVVHTLTKTRF